MKIQLSKSQWEHIGRTAGWMDGKGLDQWGQIEMMIKKIEPQSLISWSGGNMNVKIPQPSVSSKDQWTKIEMEAKKIDPNCRINWSGGNIQFVLSQNTTGSVLPSAKS